MTRFDEPIRQRAATAASPLRTAVRLAGDRPIVAACVVLLTCGAIVCAVALVAAQMFVPAALGQAFAANPVVVYAAPGGSRGDTDALGVRLEALPGVADVVLRPKEEALVALIQAGLPPASDGRNPLPDAWVLTVRPDPGAHASFVTTATGLRDTLAALPGVDQVRLDARWNERLEAWSADWRRYGRPTAVLGLILTVLGVAATWFLARDAILRPLPPGEAVMRVLTYYVALAVMAAGGLASLLVGSLQSIAATAPGWLRDSTAMDVWTAVGVTAGTTGIAFLVAIVATCTNRRDSQNR